MKNIAVKLGMAVTLILFFGCKKTKLSDENMILKGSWKWIQSEKIIQYAPTGYTVHAGYILANGYEHQYKIDIRDNGHLFLCTDGDCKKYRFSIENFGLSGNVYNGIFVLRTGKNRDLDFQVFDDTIDTLRMFNYPLETWKDDNGNSYSYVSYFVRE